MALIIKDFFERKQISNYKKHLRSGDSETIHMYDLGVRIGEAFRFYDFQQTDRNWQELFRALKKFCTNSPSVLDVGCGPYELMEVGNREEVIGVDFSGLALKKLKSFGFLGQVIRCDAFHLPFKDETFEITVSNQVIEHMPTAQSAIAFVKELERVSHRVVVVTPNSAYLRKVYE